MSLLALSFAGMCASLFVFVVVLHSIGHLATVGSRVIYVLMGFVAATAVACGSLALYEYAGYVHAAYASIVSGALSTVLAVVSAFEVRRGVKRFKNRVLAAERMLREIDFAMLEDGSEVLTSAWMDLMATGLYDRLVQRIQLMHKRYTRG